MTVTMGAGSLALTVASVIFLLGGFVACGVLWWLMVLRPRERDGPPRRRQ